MSVPTRRAAARAGRHIVKRRVLVIGPDRLRDAIARLAPEVALQTAARPLEGLWLSGGEPFDCIVVSASIGPAAARLVESLRQTAPQAHIVVSASAPDEPLARRLLEAGASDYVLEPLRRDELEQALRIVRPQPLPEAPIAQEPTPAEIRLLSEALRDLSEGPQPIARRLCRLLCAAFHARGALIQIDDLAASEGEVSEPVLQHEIRREDRVVGRVALARSLRGAYPPLAALRLGEYAALIETCVSQAAQRQHWQQLAWSDDLTGLPNARFLECKLDELIGQAAAARKRLTVVIFDVAGLRDYNQAHGRAAGDRLLRELGELLRRTTRGYDVVGRWGADEFVAILVDGEPPRRVGSEHPRQVAALARRFEKALSERAYERLGRDRPGPVVLYGGLACYPWDGATREQLLTTAERALRTARTAAAEGIWLSAPAPQERAG